jgi:hypothetical protein
MQKRRIFDSFATGDGLRFAFSDKRAIPFFTLGGTDSSYSFYSLHASSMRWARI